MSLTSNDTSELLVPATVTIAAGQTSAAFNLTIVDDSDHDGAQTATVTAGNAAFADATGTVVVHDNELDQFVWDTIGGSKTAGVAFAATVRAKNVDHETIVVYSGTPALSAAGDSGSLPVAPTSLTFASGVWTGNVTVNAADANVTFRVDSGAGIVGTSNAITVWAKLQVASTTPPAGGVFTLPGPFTYDVTFNEPITPASVTTGSLVLSGISGAAVSGVTVLPGNTTARFTIGGIAAEGTLTASIAAGAVTDPAGNAGSPFSATYFVDIGTAAFPVPLTLVPPSGSLIYSGQTVGTIGPAADTDSFTIDLDAGQTMTALADPAGGFQPTLAITGPGDVNTGLVASPGAGKDAVLQTVAVAAAGTYTVTVGSAGGTTGSYTLQLTLNAALAAEEHDGPSDDTLATAQNIDGSFVALSSGARRGAVVGTLAGLGAGTTWSISASSCMYAIPDTLRNIEYITTSTGDVLRYDLAGRAFLAPFHLGGSLLGADISPDQNTLVVADTTFSGGHNWIYVIDLTTGTSRQITFPLASGEGGMYDVAFIDNNTVLADSTYQGSGWVPLRKVNLTTGAATSVGSVRMTTVLSASADHSVVGIAEGNEGPIGPKRYRVSDGNILGVRPGWDSSPTSPSAAMDNNTRSIAAACISSIRT